MPRVIRPSADATKPVVEPVESSSTPHAVHENTQGGEQPERGFSFGSEFELKPTPPTNPQKQLNQTNPSTIVRMEDVQQHATTVVAPSMDIPPSPHYAEILAFMQNLVDLPARKYLARTEIYHQLFEHLKTAAAQDASVTQQTPHGGGTYASQQQTEATSDIEYVVGMLPQFYRALLQDVHHTLEPSHENEDNDSIKSNHSTNANNVAAESVPVPAVPANPKQRERDALLLARAAVRTLGYFLHHPTHCTHFPLAHATQSMRTRPNTIPEEDAMQVDSSSAEEGLDGMVVLLNVLANSPDRQLASMISWLLGEQCLSSTVLTCYIDQCIDAFLSASQLSQKGRSSHSPGALQEQIIHALWKFARLTPQVLRDRCRSTRPNSLDWLRQLILLPYLNPTFYFDLSVKSESSSELRKLSLKIMDLLLGSSSSSSSSNDGQSLGDFLLREYSTHSAVADFSSKCQKCVHDGGWIKSTVEHVKLQVSSFEAERMKAIVEQIPGATAGTNQPPSEASAAIQTEYERKVTSLYLDTFSLLNVYLTCMGKVATIMAPTSSASASLGLTASSLGSQSGATVPLPAATPQSGTSSSSTAAINSFLTFYQPLFSHSIPAIRQLVFEKAWKHVVRVLNTEERLVAGVLPSARGKNMLPLSMKPFLHQIAKEKDASVIASVLKTWLEIIAENFLTRTNNGTGSIAPQFDVSHRIQKSPVYDECIGKVLKLLAGKLAWENSTVGTAWDTHQRARMLEEILDGLKWTAPPSFASSSHGGPSLQSSSNPPLQSHSHSHDHNRDTTTSMHTSSSAATGSTLGSGGASATSNPPQPALSWLPVIMQVLLSLHTPSTARSTFLQQIVPVMTKTILRVAGANERKAVMALYQHLIECAIKQPLPPVLVQPERPADGTPQVSLQPASTSEPHILLQALFQSWIASGTPLASMLVSSQSAPPSSPSIASTASSLTPPLVSEKTMTRVHWACSMQFNLLKEWLGVKHELERLVGVSFGEDGIISLGAKNPSPIESGYNVTPTPLAAPSSTNSSASVSTVLICLFVRWINICAPLLTTQSVAVMSSAGQEKLREIFLDGVSTLLTHQIASVSPVHRLTNSTTLFRVLVDLLVKIVRRDTSRSNAAWLVWMLLMKTETLVDKLMPPSTPAAQSLNNDSQTPPTSMSSLGETSIDASLPNDAKGSKDPLDRFAFSLAQTVIHQPEDEDSMADTPPCASLETNENSMELLVYTMLSAILMHTGPVAAPATSSNVDWQSLFNSCSARILATSMSTSASPHSQQPDVMAILVQGLLECQKSVQGIPLAEQVAPLALFVKTVASLVNELHPSSSLSVRLSSPASSSSANWKQWKSHPDALSQRVVCGVLEDAAKHGASGVVPAFLTPLLSSLVQLFGRFPHSVSVIDAVAWFLRLLSGFHSLLLLTDVKKSHGAPSPQQSVITPLVELWSASMTAFRKNFHGELDFQLLQTAVGKVAVSGSTVSNAAASSSTAQTKPLLFIDVLTLSLQHSHALIRSTSVHFWTHTYASRRAGMATSKMLFGGYPEFVAACTALVAQGELKQQHLPPVVAPALQWQPGSLPATPHAPKSPGRVPVSISPSKVHFEHPTPDAVGSQDVEMRGEDGEDMGPTGMLGEAQHVNGAVATLAGRSHLASEPPSSAPRSSPSPHVPLNTAHSFLPTKNKKPNLLDRLADNPAYALPPEPIMKAPPGTSSMGPSTFAIGASPSLPSQLVESSQSKEDAQARHHTPQGQSTLSPFPFTPAGAMLSGGPVVSPPSAPTPAQRATSVLAPRALIDDFEAAVVMQPVLPDTTHSVRMPEQDQPEQDGQPMDTSTDQMVQPPQSSPPTDAAHSAPLNESQHRVRPSSQYGTEDQSLSMPLGGSISQPQPQPSQEQESQPTPFVPPASVEPAPSREVVQQTLREPSAHLPVLPPSDHIATITQSQPTASNAHRPVLTETSNSQPHMSKAPVEPHTSVDPNSTPVEQPEQLLSGNSPSFSQTPMAASQIVSDEEKQAEPQRVTSASSAVTDPSVAVEDAPESMDVDPVVEIVLPAPVPLVQPVVEDAPEPEERLKEHDPAATPESVKPPFVTTVVNGPMTSDASLPPKHRKRTYEASVHGVSPTPASKRVMFCETKNVEISPSPNFSGFSASLDEHHSHPSGNGSQQKDQKEPVPDECIDEQKAVASKSVGPSSADRRAERAERKRQHDAKKADLKAAINPIVVASSITLPSILKSPTKHLPQTKSDGDGSQDSDGASSSLYPPLTASIAPLASLQSCFSPPELAPSIMELFANNHLVTVGDVATCSTAAITQNVPIALRVYVAQKSHQGHQVSVPQLILDALRLFEVRSEQRKRKLDLDGGVTEDTVTTDETGPAAKKQKLVGPIESLQTTQQQEAWLERMLASGATSEAASSAIATQSMVSNGMALVTPLATVDSLRRSSNSQASGSEPNASPMTFVAPDLTAQPPTITRPSSLPTTNPTRILPVVPRMIPHPPVASSAPTSLASTASPPIISDGVSTGQAVQPIRPIAMSDAPPTATLPAPMPTAMSVDVPVAADDIDAEMMESMDDEPMSMQMDEIRFHMRTTMATLFACVPPSSSKTTSSTSGSATSPRSSNQNLIHHLTINQLHELQACVHSMQSAITQSIRTKQNQQQRRSPHAPSTTVSPNAHQRR